MELINSKAGEPVSVELNGSAKMHVLDRVTNVGSRFFICTHEPSHSW